MKSLFQGIRSGMLTKEACESQLGKFKVEKMRLTSNFLAKRLGKELYGKELSKLNMSIDILQFIVDKWDDLKLPLKPLETKPKPAPTYWEEKPEGNDDEQNYSTEC